MAIIMEYVLRRTIIWMKWIVFLLCHLAFKVKSDLAIKLHAEHPLEVVLLILMRNLGVLSVSFTEGAQTLNINWNTSHPLKDSSSLKFEDQGYRWRIVPHHFKHSAFIIRYILQIHVNKPGIINTYVMFYNHYWVLWDKSWENYRCKICPP